MDGTKSLLLSRTVIGLAVAVLAQLSDRLFGTDLAGAAELQREIIGYGADLVSMLGAGVAFWGRIKATKRIAGLLLLLGAGALARPIGAVLLAASLAACAVAPADGPVVGDVPVPVAKPGAIERAIAAGDAAVAEATPWVEIACANLPAAHALGVFALTRIGASAEAMEDELKAYKAAQALCAARPSNIAELLPAALAVMTSLGAPVPLTPAQASATGPPK